MGRLMFNVFGSQVELRGKLFDHSKNYLTFAAFYSALVD